MIISGVSPEAMRGQETFLRLAFGRNKGYVCIAFLDKPRVNFSESFFSWPNEMPKIIEAIQDRVLTHNVYFCPQLFKVPRRVKEAVAATPSVWSDLDACPPEELLLKPTVLIESSPKRYQALWCLEDDEDPAVAENLSRRVAYAHASHGADKSGWDLTQLLRVPYTYNYKYDNGADTPLVGIERITSAKFRPSDFELYDEVESRPGMDMPAPGTLPDETGDEIFKRMAKRIPPRVRQLYQDTPESESWSEDLFHLEMSLFEAGLSREEVYVVAQSAACNKYARDNRPDEQLWRDVCRAHAKHLEEHNAIIVPVQELTPLLSQAEIDRLGSHETFVERFIRWASGLGDAAPQYHEAGAFVILSAMLAGKVFLPTSFGNVFPNLWFMILADTTLTRKSTAMDIAIDLLIEVDEEAIMATDGSLEGLLQGLALRPGRPSIFLRDEFSGLLEAMTKKDYMAGMAETLTKLYDGKYMKRILRKESIEVKDPRLIVFAGGIKTRVQQLLTLDWVSSGFMPRFVFLTAVSDVSKVKPLGPPEERDLSGKDELLEELNALYTKFNEVDQIKLPNNKVIEREHKWEARLTPDAWLRFNQFETEMLKNGIASDRPDIMTAVFDRLGKSALKAAILLAAVDSNGSEVVIEEIHILRALRYCEKWREYAIDIINGVGQSAAERDLDRILKSIQKRPGISRSTLMQNHHLTSRTADGLFETLVQRNLIRKSSHGKGALYYPINEFDIIE